MQYGQQHHIDIQAQAAGAVIINANHEVLLVQELTGSKKGLWHIPSGSVEAGEFPQQTAQREIEEETGLRLTLQQYINTYVGRFDDGELVLRHAWLADYDGTQVISPRFQQEIGRAQFFSREAIHALYTNQQLRMHHTYLMIEDAFRLREALRY
ncbi:NUDIX domain-containing protein [Photobacterium aphoticum]|uniref:DNA mismatch repair protein MutT n=1 Tax=Photobacterium aphoticum TaxID=754436 RepID=A0A0J1GJJ5_9GAMM|nr:NUDIX domain-containing protein [Photobacterium aphoticum]KLU99907.1 DNA mismatch repair protein MutT [Photobacterium aphoticum]PSU56852.1 NUDIX domain-containing protein [Photobacterium aphoticum]GHA40964.1 DNA mismatch repair protein MutT [Photobacterium aphoticum]